MKNLTITVEDSVLEWARVEAARRGTSVSRMVGDFMAEMQRREDAASAPIWPGARMSVAGGAARRAGVPEETPARAGTRGGRVHELVFVDTSVLVAAEDVAGGDSYAATLAWLDVLVALAVVAAPATRWR